MPGLYKAGDYDLAGFAVGAVERDEVLPRGVAAGDVVLGLASSGPHSNAYSLARKVVELSGLAWDAPCPFAPGTTLGEALLTPTRIYVRSCLAAIRETGGVKALAHITGGGFTENIPRVLPKGLGVRIDLARVPVLPVFRWLAATGGIAETEMLRTFNCGIGMIVVVAPDKADAVDGCIPARGRNGHAARRGDRGARRRAARRLRRQARSRTMTRKRVAILISGRGSNMAALIEAAQAPDYPAEIALVLSNRAGCRRSRDRAHGRRRHRGARPQALRQGPRGFRGRAAGDPRSPRDRVHLPRRVHAAVHRRLRAALARPDAQHPPLPAAGVSRARPARAGAARRREDLRRDGAFRHSGDRCRPDHRAGRGAGRRGRHGGDARRARARQSSTASIRWRSSCSPKDAFA